MNPSPTAGGLYYIVGDVAAGDSHTLRLTPEGFVLATGANNSGQLGDGIEDGADSFGFVPVLKSDGAMLTNITAVAAGVYHSVALDANGVLWTWGANWGGQLGDGTWEDRAYAAPLTVLDAQNNPVVFTAITAGAFHTVGLAADGTVWAFGYNPEGELGSGTYDSQPAPVRVLADLSGTPLANITAIAAGENFTLALDNAAHVWAWGANGEGQLGVPTADGQVDASLPTSNLPVEVRASAISNDFLSGIRAIAAGGRTAMAITSAEGIVLAWGDGIYGQLGHSTDGQTEEPAQELFADPADKSVAAMPAPLDLANLPGTLKAALGTTHALAVTGDWSLYAWGNRDFGQLGITLTEPTDPDQFGPRTDRPMPVVLPGTGMVAAGNSFSLAVKLDGTVWGWGDNSAGQLSSLPSPVSLPTPLPGLGDTDQDGLPDWWEQFAGLDPNDPTDAETLLAATGKSAKDTQASGAAPPRRAPAAPTGPDATPNTDSSAAEELPLMAGNVYVYGDGLPTPDTAPQPDARNVQVTWDFSQSAPPSSNLVLQRADGAAGIWREIQNPISAVVGTPVANHVQYSCLHYRYRIVAKKDDGTFVATDPAIYTVPLVKKILVNTAVASLGAIGYMPFNAAGLPAGSYPEYMKYHYRSHDGALDYGEDDEIDISGLTTHTSVTDPIIGSYEAQEKFDHQNGAYHLSSGVQAQPYEGSDCHEDAGFSAVPWGAEPIPAFPAARSDLPARAWSGSGWLDVLNGNGGDENGNDVMAHYTFTMGVNGVWQKDSAENINFSDPAAPLPKATILEWGFDPEHLLGPDTYFYFFEGGDVQAMLSHPLSHEQKIAYFKQNLPAFPASFEARFAKGSDDVFGSYYGFTTAANVGQTISMSTYSDLPATGLNATRSRLKVVYYERPAAPDVPPLLLLQEITHNYDSNAADARWDIVQPKPTEKESKVYFRDVLFHQLPKEESEIKHGDVSFAITPLTFELRDVKNPDDASDDVLIEPKKPFGDISKSSIAWIEPHKSIQDASPIAYDAGDDPRMPQLEAQIKGLPSSVKLQWKLKCSYKRPSGRELPEDVVKVPLDGSFKEVSGDQSWKIWLEYADLAFFGGDAELTFMSVGPDGSVLIAEQTESFRIAGRNPDDTRCRTYIDKMAAELLPQSKTLMWYAYAIAKSETKAEGGEIYYNQFLAKGIKHPRKRQPSEEDAAYNNTKWNAGKGKEGVPNWNDDSPGAPMGQKKVGGYGIKQVTGWHGDDNGNVPRAVIWNWKVNVEEGLKELVGKHTDARDWMTKQRAAASKPLPPLTVSVVTFAEKLYGADPDDEPEPAQFFYKNEIPRSGYYCYWNGAGAKWSLSRYNSWNPPFNYVERVCEEVEP